MFSYLRQPKGFYRRLFLLALPIIVQNLITTSLGFLDTFMVGLLGSNEMSAVTVANVPIFIIQLIVFGLQSGSSVLISQYWGRGDRESINRVIGIGLCIAGSVSTIVSFSKGNSFTSVPFTGTGKLKIIFRIQLPSGCFSGNNSIRSMNARMNSFRSTSEAAS